MPRPQPLTDDVEVYIFVLRRADRRSRRRAAGAAGMNSAGGWGLGMICLQHQDTFLGRFWYIPLQGLRQRSWCRRHGLQAGG